MTRPDWDAEARERVRMWRATVGADAVPERDYYEPVDYAALAESIAALARRAEREGMERAAALMCPFCAGVPGVDPRSVDAPGLGVVHSARTVDTGASWLAGCLAAAIRREIEGM